MKRSALILGLLLLASCEDNTLETGYRPRALTDSPAARKSYYVNPYSPDANPDPQAPVSDPSQNRPRGF